MRRRQSLAQRIEFLDPADCGSAVGYVILRGRHGIAGEVTLTDCNRKLEWYFASDNPLAIQKVEKAIEILTEFRDKLAQIKSRRRRKR